MGKTTSATDRYAEYLQEHNVNWHTMQRGEVPKLPKAFDFSGVYLIFDDDETLLYVGESVSIYRRIKKHIKITLKRDDSFVFKDEFILRPTVGAVEIQDFMDRVAFEAELIKHLRPRLNVAQHSLHLPNRCEA
jgi:excinuclease UvrABC nuclease subunit